MNRRVLALTVIASLGTSSVAFAEESLLQSGSRVVQEIARAQPSSAIPAQARTHDLARVARVDAARPEALLAQEQPVLEKSGMSKKTKFMIYAGIGVGFALAAYTIDHNVLNITPSTLGTRKD